MVQVLPVFLPPPLFIIIIIINNNNNKLLLNHLLGIYYFIRQTNNVIPVFNQVIRYDVVLIVVVQ